MTDARNSIDSRSLERIVPDGIHADEATGAGTLQLHPDRYQFAKENLLRGSLLEPPAQWVAAPLRCRKVHLLGSSISPMQQ
ncbi:MAG: hypothetical protein ACLQVL_26525 [Terriglobia bacterium]